MDKKSKCKHGHKIDECDRQMCIYNKENGNLPNGYMREEIAELEIRLDAYATLLKAKDALIEELTA